MSGFHTVESIPLIKDSVGVVTAIAPASGVQQVTAGDMDGVMMMRLVLDVADDIVVLNSGHVAVDAATDTLQRDEVDLHQHLGIF